MNSHTAGIKQTKRKKLAGRSGELKSRLAAQQGWPGLAPGPLTLYTGRGKEGRERRPCSSYIQGWVHPNAREEQETREGTHPVAMPAFLLPPPLRPPLSLSTGSICACITQRLWRLATTRSLGCCSARKGTPLLHFVCAVLSVIRSIPFRCVPLRSLPACQACVLGAQRPTSIVRGCQAAVSVSASAPADINEERLSLNM